MLTYQIYKNDKLVKTIASKGMNSIYTQYKKYCFTRHASVMMQCDQNTSVGLMYWTNYSENYYLKSAQIDTLKSKDAEFPAYRLSL